MSGKNTDRPELKRMMNYVREGDVVIVESISRFARNTKDLLELVEKLTAKQVEFISKKEAIDTTTPTGKFMLTVFGAVAELEREYILQRQKEGIAVAKQNGIYKGRKPIEHPNSFEISFLDKPLLYNSLRRFSSSFVQDFPALLGNFRSVFLEPKTSKTVYKALTTSPFL